MERELKNSSRFISGHLEICRFDHWIKNAFVLPGVVVALWASPSSLNSELCVRALIGLLSIGLIASSNYVMNELLDAPFDLTHPKKKFRPVPEGRVRVGWAYVQWIALMALGMGLAAQVSMAFSYVMLALWFMGCCYNIPPIRTKDVPFLDVLSESVNNPIRMLAGWYIVAPPHIPSSTLLASYWMVGCYFMALKRFAEFREIKDRINAGGYRKSFQYYNERLLLVSIMFYSSVSMLFLGAFIMRYRLELILAFPFVAWVMAVYLNLAFEEDSAVQAPEKLYREPVLMLSVLVCSLVMAALLFWPLPGLTEFFAPSLPT